MYALGNYEVVEGKKIIPYLFHMEYSFFGLCFVPTPPNRLFSFLS